MDAASTIFYNKNPQILKISEPAGFLFLSSE